MSFTSQGPGWWLASDGKWYPPQPPTPPPGPPPSTPPPAFAPPEGPPPGAPSTPAAPPPFAAVPAPPKAPVALSPLTLLGAVAAMGGAVLVIIGAVLPWASVSLGGFGSIDKAGTDGDGVITLVLALFVGGLGLGLLLARAVRTAALGLSVGILAGSGLIGLIAVIDMADISSKFANSSFATVSIGIGLWLTLFAALVCGVASLLGLAGAVATKPAP